MSFMDTQKMHVVDMHLLSGLTRHVVDMPSYPKMPIAKDIHVDACSIQLASLASVTLAFGGLMYEMLILGLDIPIVARAFAINILVIDIGIAHGGVMQIVCTQL